MRMTSARLAGLHAKKKQHRGAQRRPGAAMLRDYLGDDNWNGGTQSILRRLPARFPWALAVLENY